MADGAEEVGESLSGSVDRMAYDDAGELRKVVFGRISLFYIIRSIFNFFRPSKCRI